MKTICAWCKADLGGTDDGTGDVSHGMCQSCFERLSKSMNPGHGDGAEKPARLQNTQSNCFGQPTDQAPVDKKPSSAPMPNPMNDPHQRGVLSTQGPLGRPLCPAGGRSPFAKNAHDLRIEETNDER